MSPQQPKKNFGPAEGNGTSPGLRLLMMMVVLLALFWLAGRIMGGPAVNMQQIDYSLFREQLKAGNVGHVSVQGSEITGSFEEQVTRKTGEDATRKIQDFVTYVPSFGDEQLLSLLEEHEVEIATQPETETSWLWFVIAPLVPFLLIFGFMYYQARKMGGQGGGGPMGGRFMQITKSKAKQYEKGEEDASFDDVAGCESAKTELKEIVAFLKDPHKIKDLGGEVPRGVLLLGSPGTGKTLLARAVAGEADVPFFSISGSDFMEMFVGVGASRVRNMFEDAKKNAPSIIFIDELDSIGRQRGAGLGGGHDEREQTLNQLLSELDGFEPNENVIVMAATNRPDILDKALLRPGRFDRRVTVNMPTTRDRVAILKIHARNKPLADDVDLEKVARGTPGFSGADLENLLQEAALLAARKDRKKIGNDDIEEARDKVLMGLERKGLVLNDEERRFIAYHESGHAIVAAVLPKADPIHKVSTIPRSRSMGVTQQLPEKEKYIYPYEYLHDRLAVMMGGRVAEEMIFDSSTSGAGDDLLQATKLARRMVVQWGMSDKFRNMALGGEQQEVFLGQEITGRRDYSDDTAREVDQAVREILQQAYDKAGETLKKHREQLDRLAEMLMEEEEVPGEKVLELVGAEKSKDEKQKKSGKDEKGSTGTNG